MTTAERTSSDLIEALHRRASVRRFTRKPVPVPVIDDLLAAAIRAPTSFNLQAYSMVVVTDPVRLGTLATLTGQPHVAGAPVVVVVCADLARMWRLGGRFGEPVGPEHDDLTLTSVIDASLAGMCLALAAESVGLGTVMLGAVRNRPDETAELLALPVGTTALFGVCLGWPAAPQPERPRLRPDLLGHPDRYDLERADASLDFDVSTLWKARGSIRADEIIDWRKQVVRGLKRARARSEKQVPTIRAVAPEPRTP
ncbi:nitroreductase family protein [Streptomyces sp. NPDC058469]|uniref:nitroreductase family protein n=1 Tax=Streptomyces sp. NPDC058469 TaxID=3346514 RepID=UPI00365CB091